MTFEITVKALTVAVHRRLCARDQRAGASNGTVGDDGLPSSLAEPMNVVVSGLGGGSFLAAYEHGPLQPRPALQRGPEGAEDLRSWETRGIADAFLARAPAHIETLRTLVRRISEAATADASRESLEELMLRVRSLMHSAGLAGLRPAFQIGAAVDGLLKKLAARSGDSNASSHKTVAAAVELLQELCVNGVKCDITDNPPIRILVVDDYLISRRAIAGALQLSFEKPDLAENGEAALLLASERSYDVIFMDVLMPGMDGFTACSKIHKTPANHDTPVVLVTNHAGPELLTQCDRCGGSDIATKPLFKAEITVKALTFALRRRLGGNDSADWGDRAAIASGPVE